MTVNSDLRKALRTWEHSDLTEYNEAPFMVRALGVVTVSALTAVTLLL
jgi:hypothetical protein